MPLRTGCWKLLKVSNCTGHRVQEKAFCLQEDPLSGTELYWRVGVRVKEMGSKAVFTVALPSPLPSSHLGLFPTALERKKEWKIGWLFLSHGYLFPRLDSEKPNLTSNNLQFVSVWGEYRFDRIFNCLYEYFFELQFQLETFWSEAIPTQLLSFLSVA